MPRGRSKDTGLVPTRALAQQREYRARKAARIEYLEQRVNDLQRQNDQLREEIQEYRLGSAGGRYAVQAVNHIREHLQEALNHIDHLGGSSRRRSSGREAEINTGSSMGSANGSDDVSTSPRAGFLNSATNSESRSPDLPDSQQASCSQAPQPTIAFIHPMADAVGRVKSSEKSGGRAVLAERQYSDTCMSGESDYSPHERDDPNYSVAAMDNTAIGDAGYDQSCCRGVIDCSHLPPSNEDRWVSEVEDVRALSHCEVEGMLEARAVDQSVIVDHR